MSRRTPRGRSRQLRNVDEIRAEEFASGRQGLPQLTYVTGPVSSGLLERVRWQFRGSPWGRPGWLAHRRILCRDARRDPLQVSRGPRSLDELGIDRAHFVGMSWGGRLGFGIAEHAPERALSLVIGGQQPYAWPDSPLTRAVTEGLAVAQVRGMEAAVQALEQFWDLRVPDARRQRYLDNDPVALEAAWRAVLAEGAISNDLGAWQVPCLIFLGAADADFLDLARQAASEIPNAEFISLEERDHYRAHTDQDDLVIEAVLRTLRRHA